MIKKLKIRVILLSMSSLFVLLAVIVTGMNLANYGSVVSDADKTLQLLSQNRGRFPEFALGEAPRGLSPELPFASRYFSVVLKEDGTPVQTDTTRVAAVDREAAVAYAQKVLGGGDTRGFMDQYRFVCREEGAFVRIIFLDCGRELDAFYRFLTSSLVMALVGFMVMFLVIFFFAGRIVRPIAESYEKQKRFITDAGHEIKTPLTIIGADADVLEMEIGENEWLADIQKQTQRLGDLTRELTYLARMEEGEREVPMAEFSFTDTAMETATSFQALAQTQNKAFTLRIQPQLTLRGNDKAIIQLISILLDNAVKYTPEGGTICLTAERQERQLRLSVNNTTAVPVTQEQLGQLFERFYRVDSSRNSRTGGYGIGLSIAKAIVTAHGGKIQAAAKTGKDLTITAVFSI